MIKSDLISVDSNQILRIKLEKSCEHVRAYGPHNMLWWATCGLRAVVAHPCTTTQQQPSFYGHYAGQPVLAGTSS